MDRYPLSLNLSLPNTSFPMRACLVDVEPKMISRWYNEPIYKAVRCSKKYRKICYIHDGPPFANGQIHIGHAVNKALKDITIKSKELMGYYCLYIPGWDCHGLPIEIKLESMLYKRSIRYSTISFYSYCIRYVSKQVFIQRESFMRLGVICDWEAPYLTMDNDVKTNTIHTLLKTTNKERLYRENKPVYWCVNCQSSLAEAELEYCKQLGSSVYIVFKTIDTKRIASMFGLYKNNHKARPIYSNVSIDLIAWTTTVWNIPANQAVAANSSIEYQLIKAEHRYYMVASCLVYNIMERLSIGSWTLIGKSKGLYLGSIRTYHPTKGSYVPVVISEHVTTTAGTGLVHIAPAHGLEDYYIGKRHMFNILNIVSDQGNYLIASCLLDSYYILHGLSIDEPNPKPNPKPNPNASNNIGVLLIKGKILLHMGSISHVYSYCWRHKLLVIYRTTPQWFIKTNSVSLVKRNIHSIKDIIWIPKWGQERMESMLIGRPDWCISRQRSWGIPIPIYTHIKTNEIHPRTSELLSKVSNLVEAYGIEAWHSFGVLLGKSIHPTIRYYCKCSSILDVWFESGATYFYMVGKLRLKFDIRKPDLCLEGSDQYRGWLMSLLMLSNIITEDLPYREALTHGFVVDVDGFKMSKSIGNVVNPLVLVDVYGADVFRIWVSLNDFAKEVQYSEEAIKQSSDIYRRIRNTIRYLLASLNGFHPKSSLIPFRKMLALDNWIISCIYRLQKDIIDAYNRYQLHIIIKHVMQVCSIELGSSYLDIVKDRIYTASVKSVTQRSCQSTLFHMLEAMVLWVYPIIPFTTNEIWFYLDGKRTIHTYAEGWYSYLSFVSLNMDRSYWYMLMQVRSDVNKATELERLHAFIGSSLETCGSLYAGDALAFMLLRLGSELPYLLLVSESVILSYNEVAIDINTVQDNLVGVLMVSIKKINGIRCARCWYYTVGSNIIITITINICGRCFSNVVGLGERRMYI